MGGIPDSKNRLTVAAGQAFTTQAITANYIKLGKGLKVAKKTIGMAGNLIKFWPAIAFTGLDSGVVLELVVATTSVFTTPIVIAQTPELTLAQLNSGKPTHLDISAVKLEDKLTIADLDVYMAVRFSPVSEAGAAGKLIVQIDDSPETDVG
jgi:hypothetical protein